MQPEPYSALTGVRWPAVSTPPGALALAMQFQLERSEWLPAEELQRLQFAQLGALLDHAFGTSTFWRTRLGQAGYRVGMTIHPDWFGKLPTLSRQELQQHPQSILSARIPPQHGQIYGGDTSGSTGIPVRCHGTDVTLLMWKALTVRDHAWHGHDVGGKFIAIRAGAETRLLPSWGDALDAAYRTGPLLVLSAKMGVDALLDRICDERPMYLGTYSSMLRALAYASLAAGRRPEGLRGVRTVGEALHDDVRDLVGRAWKVNVVDTYSAVEAGYIALQCPSSMAYHVQSESALVEILDEHDQPCPPGTIGRVVITLLHNFAMPLIRYDIGDYAQAGSPCACGRGLPVLDRIIGRRRNMMVLPDGRRIWPTIAARDWREIAPIVQCRFVQKERTRVEAEVVAERALSRQEIDRFAALVTGRWTRDGSIRLDVREVAQIARTPGEKYEDFVCDLA